MNKSERNAMEGEMYSIEGLRHMCRCRNRQQYQLGVDTPLDEFQNLYRPCLGCGWAVNDFMVFCVKCKVRFEALVP
mgnify:CR=1 FL=1